jgi:hypothetical protein
MGCTLYAIHHVNATGNPGLNPPFLYHQDLQLRSPHNIKTRSIAHKP